MLECNDQSPVDKDLKHAILTFSKMTEEQKNAACIGCMKCVKACRFDSIKVENNLAYINPETCRNCTMCVKECPTGAIMQLPRPKKPAAKTQTAKPQPSQPENQQVANA